MSYAYRVFRLSSHDLVGYVGIVQLGGVYWPVHVGLNKSIAFVVTPDKNLEAAKTAASVFAAQQELRCIVDSFVELRERGIFRVYCLAERDGKYFPAELSRDTVNVCLDSDGCSEGEAMAAAQRKAETVGTYFLRGVIVHQSV